jgi:hypothetical protein
MPARHRQRIRSLEILNKFISMFSFSLAREAGGGCFASA